MFKSPATLAKRQIKPKPLSPICDLFNKVVIFLVLSLFRQKVAPQFHNILLRVFLWAKTCSSRVSKQDFPRCEPVAATSSVQSSEVFQLPAQILLQKKNP
jgi:hypothetical protein